MTAVVFFAENSIFTSELPLNRRVIEGAGSFAAALPGISLSAVAIFAVILLLNRKFRVPVVFCILIALAAGVLLFGVLQSPLALHSRL